MHPLPERVRAFLDRLFPKELAAYVPGGKLVAGVILALLASVFGIGGEVVVTLPGVGEITVAALALAVGFYLYPPPPRPPLARAVRPWGRGASEAPSE